MIDIYRVNDLVKYNYSEIGEYIGEGYTDKPLRNDEVVKLLNEHHKYIDSIKDDIIHAFDSRINELNDELDKAVKNGMPSSILYDEIEVLEELKAAVLYIIS